MKIKRIVLIALTTLALGLASIGVTAPAIADTVGGHGGDANRLAGGAAGSGVEWRAGGAMPGAAIAGGAAGGSGVEWRAGGG